MPTEAARARLRIGSATILLTPWIRQGYGLVGCIAVTWRNCLPCDGAYPYPDLRNIRRTRSPWSPVDWNDRFDSGEPVRSYRFNYSISHPTQQKIRRRGHEFACVAVGHEQLELLHTREVSDHRAGRGPFGRSNVDSQLNAFADFDAERVRAQARRLDEQTEPRGPLHGFPLR